MSIIGSFRPLPVGRRIRMACVQDWDNNPHEDVPMLVLREATLAEWEQEYLNDHGKTLTPHEREVVKDAYYYDVAMD